MKINSKISVIFRAAILAAVPLVSALAQENTVNLEARDLEYPQLGRTTWEAGVTSGYDWSSSAKFQGAHLGDSDAFNLRLGVGAHVPLQEPWFLQLGVLSDNFYLQQVTSAPVPDAINTLRLNAGLGYRLNSDWTITGLFSPALYRFDRVEGSDFGFSGGVMAAYRVQTNLHLTFGLIGSPDSDVPVLPVAGLRWRINDDFLLEAGIPRTRLSYFIQRRWPVYVGANFNGTIFRATDHLGNQIGRSQYNNALGEYRDIRVGVGTSYAIFRGLSIEAEGGYSVYRDIDYKRIDQDVRFGPAPYVRMAIGYRF